MILQSNRLTPILTFLFVMIPIGWMLVLFVDEFLRIALETGTFAPYLFFLFIFFAYGIYLAWPGMYLFTFYEDHFLLRQPLGYKERRYDLKYMDSITCTSSSFCRINVIHFSFYGGRKRMRCYIGPICNFNMFQVLSVVNVYEAARPGALFVLDDNDFEYLLIQIYQRIKNMFKTK